MSTKILLLLCNIYFLSINAQTMCQGDYCTWQAGWAPCYVFVSSYYRQWCHSANSQGFTAAQACPQCGACEIEGEIPKQRECIEAEYPNIVEGGGSCENMDKVCAGMEFLTSVDTSVGVSNREYSCLGSVPNPAWFYFEIETSGPFLYHISADRDIDFIVYGPFPDANSAKAQCNDLDNVVDCSFSLSSSEFVNIPNAMVGEIYVLLVTNFANTYQAVTGELDIASSGTVTCSGVGGFPSESPSSSYPSTTPTIGPTQPTASPSSSYPSTAPTMKPTQPTASPSSSYPSTAPSVSPSEYPTSTDPSTAPSMSPTHPTACPTSSDPSAAPTTSPSGSPTVENIDCEGTWGTCDLYCDRRWNQIKAQSGNGAPCPEEPECVNGQDLCNEDLIGCPKCSCQYTCGNSFTVKMGLKSDL